MVGPGIRRDPLRVLVVDDDDSTRKMLTQFFNDEGFETLAAENGAHALAVASADEPDVIVLDMGLPVLDASGFARQWERRENAVEIPIVAIRAR